MKRAVLFLMLIPGVIIGMQDQRMAGIYTHHILPHMPSCIAPEKAVTTLTRLAETNFDTKFPEWKFKHLMQWMQWRAHDVDVQVDIGILKRYMATIIDKATPETNLGHLSEDIIENKDALRWVVIADGNSALSDERIKQRWDLFVERVSESIPLDVNNA